jgi:allophanate hydrolase
MNLLDYAAVNVPVGFLANGLPSGVTLFGRASPTSTFSVWPTRSSVQPLPLVGGSLLAASLPAATGSHDRMALVVCGAHLDGLALNGQLRERGGRLLTAMHSARAIGCAGRRTPSGDGA